MIETVFHSEDLPVADRFEGWRELIARTLSPSDVTSEHADDFQAWVKILDAGATPISVLSYHSLRASRTPALIRRSDPEIYQLSLTLRGKQGISHCGRDAMVAATDILLYDTSHPYDLWVLAEQEAAETIIVDLPRSVLLLPTAKIDRLLSMRLPGNTGIGVLLSQFLIGLTGEAASCRAQDVVRLGGVTVDLIAAFLAHHADAEDAVPPESRQQALVVGIYSFIEHNLGDSQLSPAVVAAAHHISVRYLHRLFQPQGTTISAWIRHRRLERCRRDLAEPQLHSLPVHAVGARWGFRHASDFSRAFRAAYGMPPGEYREQDHHPK
ncbi:AraC-like ligand-binding domain-containing protein [Streptomyces mirabilis]|uniref:AraC-like ligand-binding domain-containing protein n=1 Tax=Streptomyces mirabilis TaxID=68239 RepID=UPI0036DDA717